MYQACEQLNIYYTLGIGMNATLKKASDALLAEAVAQWQATGQAQRLFTALEYQAQSWSTSRWVVIKCEANAEGTNRRAVVSNRPGMTVLPGAVYDAYAERGESENRNKELKRGLQADRLSDHRYFANLFRLYLHAAAYNLLARMRQVVADPPAEPESHEMPNEALGGTQRRDWHNHRREHDPLGEGQPALAHAADQGRRPRTRNRPTRGCGTFFKLALSQTLPASQPTFACRSAAAFCRKRLTSEATRIATPQNLVPGGKGDLRLKSGKNLHGQTQPHHQGTCPRCPDCL